MSKQERAQNFLKQPQLSSSVKEVINQNQFALGEWPEKKWWAAFQEKELSFLIDMTLDSNPSLQAIKERIGFAKQESIIAGSKLFPLLYFDADDSILWLSKYGVYQTLNPTISPNGNLIDLSLSFTYEFDFWSKYKNLFRAAKFREMMEIAESKQVELIISTALAQTYYALKTNLQRKILYEQLALVRKKYNALQTLLNKKALFSKIPPTISQESYLAALQFVANITDEIAKNKHFINILAGRGPDEKLAIDETCSDFDFKITIPETLNLNLIARRPDLMAAIFRTEALACEVGAAISDFYPNINLKALGGLNTLKSGFLFNPESLQGSITPALSLPIYTAGAIKANVRGKKNLYNQAVFDYNDLLLKSTQEIADLLSFLDAVFKKKDFQSSIVDQAELRYNIISHNYIRGLSDLLEVYMTEEEVILKCLENIELVYAEYLGAIKLIKALGGGYHEN